MTTTSTTSKKRRDLILIALIVGIAFLVFALTRGETLLHVFDTNESGLYVVIQNTEGEHEVVPLSRNAEITVHSALGENTVTIENSSVWISQSDCKNQVCVQTGKMSRARDTIVCLPHHLVIQIVENPEEAIPLAGIIDQ